MTPYIEAMEAQFRLLRAWSGPAGQERAATMRLSLLATRGSAPSVDVFCKMRAEELETAETYYVSENICRLLQSTVGQFPKGVRPSFEMFPSTVGWVYFANPITIRSDAGWGERDGIGHLRGFTWWTGRFMGAGKYTGSDNDVIGMVFYADHPVTQAIEMHSVLDWPISEPWNGWHGGTEAAPWPPQADDDERAGATSRRVVLALMSFMSDSIARVDNHHPDRAARRRLERIQAAVHEPVVRVIELRRKETRGDERDDHQDVDWSCQWIVRGHWHRYRTKDGLQPRWVNPYTKGPDDKPLKPSRARVFAVVR
jgi:plasmid maintenance system killer protein